jgi:hypothetical protein
VRLSPLLEAGEKYRLFNVFVKTHNLEQIHLVKPVIDGKKLIGIYEVKAGKGMKEMLDEELRWMMLNPGCSEEEVKDYMMVNKEKFISKYM